jgi:MerR family transcriptional regulator, redox-sensitive transcriptional activator SoxR
MRELSIGEVARTSGLPASTLRYYEKAGLLPPPGRTSGQRRYGVQALGRIRLVRLAIEAGFTISETRTFLSGFSAQTPPAARWRTLATRKLREIEAQMERAQRMRALLENSFRCQCPCLEDCERYLAEAPCRPEPSCEGR